MDKKRRRSEKLKNEKIEAKKRTGKGKKMSKKAEERNMKKNGTVNTQNGRFKRSKK